MNTIRSSLPSAAVTNLHRLPVCADALNFGILFVVLDVLLASGDTSGSSALIAALTIPTSVITSTFATDSVSALPRQRYSSCPHPFTPITTLAACHAAALDVVAENQSQGHIRDYSKVTSGLLHSHPHKVTSYSHVVAALRMVNGHYGCHVKLFTSAFSETFQIESASARPTRIHMNTTNWNGTRSLSSLSELLDMEAACLSQPNCSRGPPEPASKTYGWRQMWPRPPAPVNSSLNVIIGAAVANVSRQGAWARLESTTLCESCAPGD